VAEQWREHLALILCYVVIGAYWLQHHYSGRIYARTDHWFGAINLVFLLAIVVIPYPIRVWSFHLGTPFEPVASVTLAVGLALLACTWMAKWFYGMPGRRHRYAGGTPSGWFLQLTTDHPADLDIPGWPYSFGQLIDAQAAGDFAAIDGHDLPIARVHLGADPDAGLAALERALEQAFEVTPARRDTPAPNDAATEA